MNYWGKCRDGVPLYRHTDGADEIEVEDNIHCAIAEGYQYVRCQMGMYGGAGTDDLKLIASKLARAKIFNQNVHPPIKRLASILTQKRMPEAFLVCSIICVISLVLALNLSMTFMNV